MAYPDNIKAGRAQTTRKKLDRRLGLSKKSIGEDEGHREGGTRETPRPKNIETENDSRCMGREMRETKPFERDGRFSKEYGTAKEIISNKKTGHKNNHQVAIDYKKRNKLKF